MTYEKLRLQMGTSVQMLHQHYDKVNVDMISGELSGRLQRERKDLERSKEVKAEEQRLSKFEGTNVIDMWNNNFNAKRRKASN